MVICHPVRLSLWFETRKCNRCFKSRDFLLFLNTSPSSQEDAFVCISAFLAFQKHMFSQARFRQWKFQQKSSMKNYLGRREYENFTKMTHFDNATTATTASRVAETNLIHISCFVYHLAQFHK